jgi:hypothetical protein
MLCDAIYMRNVLGELLGVSLLIVLLEGLHVLLHVPGEDVLLVLLGIGGVVTWGAEE